MSTPTRAHHKNTPTALSGGAHRTKGKLATTLPYLHSSASRVHELPRDVVFVVMGVCVCVRVCVHAVRVCRCGFFRTSDHTHTHTWPEFCSPRRIAHKVHSRTKLMYCALKCVRPLKPHRTHTHSRGAHRRRHIAITHRHLFRGENGAPVSNGVW